LATGKADQHTKSMPGLFQHREINRRFLFNGSAFFQFLVRGMGMLSVDQLFQSPIQLRLWLRLEVESECRGFVNDESSVWLSTLKPLLLA